MDAVSNLHLADDHRPELPPPDFDFLAYSLRPQTELNPGPLPFSGKDEADFETASHNTRTKSNLTPEVQRSLDNSLTELRLRFVQAKETADSKARANSRG